MLAEAPNLGVRALFFDVFGTLMDWRTSVAREAERMLDALGYRLDWLAFADAWRAEYQPGMEEVRSGRQPFAKLDVLHRRNLERHAAALRIAEFVRRGARRPDAGLAPARCVAGCAGGAGAPQKEILIAPCSNGNISLMVDLARRNNLPWDAILGSEVAGDFKPKPRVYLAACEAFDLAPAQCMMVAAHTRDLVAAAKLGLRTGHIARVNEYGPNTGEPGPTAPVDIAGSDLADLATKLGA